MNLETTMIPSTGSLDAITVFWQNYEPHRGQVTVVCWGSAWTAYFGGMPEETIQEFFARCGSDYLANKLGCTQWLKQTKNHEKYLARICDAIRLHLKGVASA